VGRRSRNREQLPVQRQVFSAEFYQGPLPKPTDLAQYNDAVPDGAERILRQFEEQSAHRRSIESKVVDSNIQGERRGIIAATWVTTLFVVGGFVLIATNRAVFGVGALAWAAAQVSSSFILNILGRRRELKQKQGTQQPPKQPSTGLARQP
jgi:uncharacterized membrane protein